MNIGAAARASGMSARMIRHCESLGLWQDRARSSRPMQALAGKHIADLGARVRELEKMKATPEHLVRCCRGNSRTERPIREAPARDGALQAVPRKGRLNAMRRATRAAR